MRLFVADQAGADLSELTSGGRPVVRLSAPDLQRAQRGTARIRALDGDVAVILDVTVAVPGDFRAVGTVETVHYAGTLDGLTGLIADIDSADVADGVALISVTESPREDVRALGLEVLRRLADRGQKSA